MAHRSEALSLVRQVPDVRQMSDEDNPYISELGWCPDCQSPPKSDFAHVAYCVSHMPPQSGALDRLVDSSEYIFQSDAGEGSHALVEFIHRDARGNE